MMTLRTHPQINSTILRTFHVGMGQSVYYYVETLQSVQFLSVQFLVEWERIGVLPRKNIAVSTVPRRIGRESVYYHVETLQESVYYHVKTLQSVQYHVGLGESRCTTTYKHCSQYSSSYEWERVGVLPRINIAVSTVPRTNGRESVYYHVKTLQIGVLPRKNIAVSTVPRRIGRESVYYHVETLQSVQFLVRMERVGVLPRKTLQSVQSRTNGRESVYYHFLVRMGESRCTTTYKHCSQYSSSYEWERIGVLPRKNIAVSTVPRTNGRESVYYHDWERVGVLPRRNFAVSTVPRTNGRESVYYHVETLQSVQFLVRMGRIGVLPRKNIAVSTVPRRIGRESVLPQKLAVSTVPRTNGRESVYYHVETLQSVQFLVRMGESRCTTTYKHCSQYSSSYEWERIGVLPRKNIAVSTVPRRIGRESVYYHVETLHQYSSSYEWERVGVLPRKTLQSVQFLVRRRESVYYHV
ncbi:hypothetical protein J6590_102122 [Homalodisca vitripennis]|nr:hypothetical protein J6590_102122 [Homalodisca vitripennis]